MKPATGFRIVGFGFLVGAAVSIFQGKFGVADTDVVITRAHDPESFWRGIITMIGFGCAALYLSRFAGRPSSPSAASLLGGSENVDGGLELPNYNPDFCGKVVKGAACICVGLILVELMVLLLVQPSDDLCPGWTYHPNQPSAASLWSLAGMFTVLPALWACNVALRWDSHYARKLYDSIVSGPPEHLLMNCNWLVSMVMAGWCLFCAIPLFLMLTQCTTLSHYLNFNTIRF